MDFDHEPQLIDRALVGFRALLELAGEDVNRPGLLRTPSRALAAWLELTERPGEPTELLSTFFDDAGPVDEMVAVGPIDFASVCEHHLLPFVGKAWIAYIPDGQVVGLSKLPRLLEHFARRPQIQERLTGQITESLNKYVTSIGSACLITAIHSCASLRGVRREAPMTTASMTGAFRTNPDARQEFLSYTRGVNS